MSIAAFATAAGITLINLGSNVDGIMSVSYTHSPSPRDKRQSRMPSSA